MRIVYLTAGAGGMYCGSCLHDNRMAATLIEQGRDVVLLPLYTPPRTDEVDVSQGRVFYGGLNVYLQHTSAFFRHTPRFLSRLLDSPALLRNIGRFASGTSATALGALTVSVLEGEDGPLRRELERLVSGVRQLRPALVHIPNLMMLGLVRRLKSALGVPVLCTLSGEDIFLDALPEPYRADAFELIRQRAQDVDGFVALTNYYAAHAAAHFALPRDRVHTVRMGIRVNDFVRSTVPPPPPFVIGYLARICPEKGLDDLCHAFARLREAGRDCRLRIAGYLGPAERAFSDRVCAELSGRGLADACDFVGEVDRQGKLDFLRSLHVLAVPTRYRESKGYSVLEALASGVPAALPHHGSFPELIEETGGGLLHEPGNLGDLVATLSQLMDDRKLRDRLAERGRAAVQASFSATRSAEQVWRLYEQTVQGNAPQPDRDARPRAGP